MYTGGGWDAMSKTKLLLTDEQWHKIEPLLPELEMGALGGRPCADNRGCLEGILWVLKTGVGGVISPISIQVLLPAGGVCGCGRKTVPGLRYGEHF